MNSHFLMIYEVIKFLKFHLEQFLILSLNEI